MNFRQRIFVAITVILLIALLASASLKSYYIENKDEGRVKIVTSFYPLEYFARQIGGDLVYVETLVPYNTEVHTWEPAPADIIAADEADILVYNGAGLDEWLEDDILPAIGKGDKLIIEATDGIDLMKLGSQDEDEKEEPGGNKHGNNNYDPHTWLSPYLALLQAENIYDAIIQTDPANENYYEQRWENLRSRLSELDSRYSLELANRTIDMIFVTHAAFGYPAERYGFEQEGVIGLSADEQPGTATIAQLVEDMIKYNIFTIYIDPVYSDDYANTLSDELEKQTGENVKILKLYFMLGPKDGFDYFEQLEKNLENLKIGLGVE